MTHLIKPYQAYAVKITRRNGTSFLAYSEGKSIQTFRTRARACQFADELAVEFARNGRVRAERRRIKAVKVRVTIEELS